MKKYLTLFAVVAVVLLGLKLKNDYQHYRATHLSADTVVYYVPRHIYLHVDSNCPHLYGGWGQIARQDTYGKMKNSKMSNELCPDCTPPQYVH